MFFDDDNSSGVTGDLRSATAVAALMEGVWGMGDRYLSLTVNETGMGQAGNAAAVAVARRQEEINTKLSDLYDKTWNLLDEHREEVLRIAAVLEEKKTISGDEVSKIMGSPPGARAMREPKGWQVIFDETDDARHNGAVNRPAPALNGDRSSDQEPDPAEDPA
jgi:hypothetical protein